MEEIETMARATATPIKRILIVIDLLMLNCILPLPGWRGEYVWNGWLFLIDDFLTRACHISYGRVEILFFRRHAELLADDRAINWKLQLEHLRLCAYPWSRVVLRIIDLHGGEL